MPEPDRPAETGERTPRDRPVRRVLHDPAFPGALGISALLLFCWPFVRVPRLPLAAACAHLFAAWLLTVVALWAYARAAPPGEDEDADA